LRNNSGNELEGGEENGFVVQNMAEHLGILSGSITWPEGIRTKADTKCRRCLTSGETDSFRPLIKSLQPDEGVDVLFDGEQVSLPFRHALKYGVMQVLLGIQIKSPQTAL
jgi:hypothetical protein